MYMMYVSASDDLAQGQYGLENLQQTLAICNDLEFEGYECSVLMVQRYLSEG